VTFNGLTYMVVSLVYVFVVKGIHSFTFSPYNQTTKRCQSDSFK